MPHNMAEKRKREQKGRKDAGRSPVQGSNVRKQSHVAVFHDICR